MKKFNMPRTAGLVITVLRRMCNVIIIRKFAKMRKRRSERAEGKNVEFDLISISRVYEDYLTIRP